MYEAVINLHMHTPYSDGFYTHEQIARAALKTQLDGVIVTDHNVLVKGAERIFREGDGRTLLLVGEEIHDRTRQPQKNHLLVLGADRELAQYATDPQYLIDTARRAGGLTFIAHPVDPAAPAVGQEDLSWVDWEVHDFTGIELWNGFSEFKGRLKSIPHALFYVFFPSMIAEGPFTEALKLWDRLLARGQPVVAIGGSDAHALPIRIGPLRKTVFPFEFHFRCINTHLLLPQPLSGEFSSDRQAIYAALAAGRAFIGYDLPASTHGFRFSALGKEGEAVMGERISVEGGVTFKIRLPFATECILLKDGVPIKKWHKRDLCTFLASEKGVYRVEVYLRFLGKRRGWIFSNPIYVV
ncbi:MAG: CehA/McbA family metallohydrolase [Anaerolineales bacterium]|nr:CehA/McbA family metallohydrolase [Anaerolineales bacterium]MCS7248923.1 CehA/McbA family metallohydrolase [Anaerolineales bacterium]MDW8162736.1 CehA/McbA family metallohydrolase [Anaerolineales bacterium]MDW8446461.1 CehA/McbA family metallohydrolase [Anaerolineales bacterium]